MSDHQEFVDLAIELIDENGRAVSFQLLDKSAANPSQPWRGLGSPDCRKQINSNAAMIPAYGYRFGTFGIEADLMKRTQLLVVVAATDPDIKFTDKIIDNADEYGVLWFQLLKPGDQEILYIFGASK